MTGEIIQPPLFETGPFSIKSIAETELNKLRDLGRNRIALGVTKTGLSQGDPEALKYIFYGMHNLEIPLEILSIENPAEILSKYFAAGGLKRGNAHRNPDANIPGGFLRLVNYINWCSYNSYSHNNRGFVSLAHKFKKCFNDSSKKQRERFELLEQSMGEDVGKEFVRSFFSPYRYSDKENSLIYDFHDPGNKKDRVGMIYNKLESLGKEAKKLLL